MQRALSRGTVLLIMCFYLPLRLSFLSDRVLSWPGDAWLVALDGICALDMIVGTSTAYYDFLGNLEVCTHNHIDMHAPTATLARTSHNSRAHVRAHI